MVFILTRVNQKMATRLISDSGISDCRSSICRAGQQPMSNEDGTVWVAFNGEIYNFREIRTELKKKGHIFRSDTDTEVIIHLYEEEGVNAIQRLNGMFAFALWDEKLNRLWVCRDRIGIKPLVYYWNNHILYLPLKLRHF